MWSEEFENYGGQTLDQSRWSFDIGDGSQFGLIGWGNQEREFYIEDNAMVSSVLQITAKRLTSDEANESGLNCYYGPAEWTSSRIHTAGKVEFKYGVIEIRAKMPKGVGTWPALWMLGSKIHSGTPWPDCGEIDILENTGAHPNRVQGTVHGPKYSAEHGLTSILDFESALSDGFHTYAVDWKEDVIEWFFEGNSYHRVERKEVEKAGFTWPFNQEFFLLVNLAIGGGFAGPVDPSLTKATLQIEWIRHYSVNGVGEIKTY